MGAIDCAIIKAVILYNIYCAVGVAQKMNTTLSWTLDFWF